MENGKMGKWKEWNNGKMRKKVGTSGKMENEATQLHNQTGFSP